MKKQWTKKQHFVPRMILKHHTYFRIPMRKSIIYQYDKEKDICRTVDIYDICRKDNLYEFRNEDGKRYIRVKGVRWYTNVQELVSKLIFTSLKAYTLK